ncbi:MULTISPECIES: DegT/DnrJ/EryC1/StrS family aminotransferase [Pseudanabaena]|uniref:Glutamine--scyllo-inositol transaminase n=2 Tax=Pseudanabaena TaxID=1152 RepID=L8N9B9_9CYAN|nr:MULTISPECIES: DegT/DnrJ/EryC1/StrS family aminotransferase [Pseudanabaena]ELS34808.1 Glutamine--scyllo-inositol transaminase [Pseudanabaena biceps PCC 7429]MDG3493044.1 DegT/DnrJ/EryC1/StrS family aminotransferase [Pseudanabaena catenata USMAC16]
MNKIPPFDVSQQYQQIGDRLNKAALEVLASGQYIGGQAVSQFETEFAQYIGSNHGIACNSGTDALYLALRALDIGEGAEVITSPFTFFASAETISMTGAKPVFIDIEAHSFNMNVDLIEAAITERTKAIMPVHLFGRSVDMTKLMAIAKKHNLYVIEDCAQATGATFDGQKVGNIGDVGCFSFYPTKNLGGCGDGGMMTTNNPEVARKLHILREHGSPKRYYHEYIGMNSRLDALQAALLQVKLPYLDKWNDQRREISDRYTHLLKDANIPKLVSPHYCASSVWNQYTVCIGDGQRDQVQAQLREQNIITMIYYPLPLHLQEVYRYLNYKKGDFPVTEDICDRVLSLPMFPELREEQQQRVVSTLQNILK